MNQPKSYFDRMQESIYEQFRQGGSLYEALLVVLAILAVVAAVYFVQRWQDRRRAAAAPNDPQGLFAELMEQVGLADGQRAFLMELALELRLSHPAVLLLCPKLFDSHVEDWRRRHAHQSSVNGVEPRAVLVGQIRRALFPGS